MRHSRRVTTCAAAGELRMVSSMSVAPVEYDAEWSWCNPSRVLFCFPRGTCSGGFMGTDGGEWSHLTLKKVEVTDG